MTEQSAEELAKLVRASFEFEGIRFRHPVGELCPLLVAEPDSMDRLYNSIHNLQRPLIKPDSTPKPSIPSMLLN